MAEVTRRRGGELVRGLFEVLMEHADGLPAFEALRQVEKRVPPTLFEESTYPNRPNVRRYERIVRFMTITPVKAGWMVKSRGRWSITDEGGQAYDQFQDPEAFLRESVRLYREWKKAQPEETQEETQDEVPEASATLEEAEETAWTEIQDYLQKMPPYEFQDLVAALLKAMGYYVSFVAPPGPDQGIDLIAHTDPLGTTSPRIKVQVKRRVDRINVDGLRSFMAILGDQDVGIFISTGGFTGEAEAEARRQEKRRITLLDSARLFDLWVEHYNRIPEPEKQLLPLKPVYYLAPPT